MVKQPQNLFNKISKHVNSDTSKNAVVDSASE